MFKVLDRIEAALSSKKGKIICGVVALAVIGLIVFQEVQEAKQVATEKARVEAVQADKRAAQLKADEEKKAGQERKAAAENQYNNNHPVSLVYEEMHEMANSIVISDDIWEEKPITKADIARLINTIRGSTYKDKQILVAMLQRWDNGIFSQAVTDHDFVWHALEGNVGRATGIDTDNLPSWSNFQKPSSRKK